MANGPARRPVRVWYFCEVKKMKRIVLTVAVFALMLLGSLAMPTTAQARWGYRGGYYGRPYYGGYYRPYYGNYYRPYYGGYYSYPRYNTYYRGYGYGYPGYYGGYPGYSGYGYPGYGYGGFRGGVYVY